MEVIVATKCGRTRRDLTDAFGDTGHSLTLVDAATELLRVCLRQGADLALVDLELGPPAGKDLVALLRDVDGDLKVVPLAGPGDVDKEFALRGEGIFYYMLKPIDHDELMAVVESANRSNGVSG
jgi:DNA-binding response OmpR family regulator